MGKLFFLLQIVLFYLIIIIYINILFKIYIFLFFLFILSLSITILFYKKTRSLKEIKFPLIEKKDNNFITYIIESFILSVKQRAFMVIYSYHLKLYKELSIRQLFYLLLSWLKIITIILCLGLPYILILHIYCLVTVIYENPNDWRYSYYSKIRDTLTYDNYFSDCEIRIFDGEIKLNGRYNDLIKDDLAMLDYAKGASSNKLHWVTTNTIKFKGNLKEVKHLQYEIKPRCLDDINVDYCPNFTYSHGIKNVKELLNDTSWGDSSTKIYPTIDNIKNSIKGTLLTDIKQIQQVSIDMRKAHLELQKIVDNKEKLYYHNNTNKNIDYNSFIESITNSDIHKLVIGLEKKNYYYNNEYMKNLLLNNLGESTHLKLMFLRNYNLIKLLFPKK